MDINKISDELKTLRSEFLEKKISKKSFVTLASEQYLLLGLPKRAIALWKYYYSEVKVNIHPATAEKTCSLNMIVKNEENNIIDALDSVDFAMDEIVICDTGSTDQTMKFAMLFGITLVTIVWNDNFSEARNSAINASTSDLIFWLDADDRIVNNEMIKLKNAWNEMSNSSLLLKISNPQKNSLPFEFMQVRVFPREKNIRFEQRIHEQIMYSLKNANIKFVSRHDIELVHTGYENTIIHKEKAERNRKLIELELVDTPNNPSLIMSLADSLTILERYQEAFIEYQKITNNNKFYAINPDIYVQAHINCANHLLKVDCTNYAVPLLEKALKLDRSRTEIMLILGKLFLKAGNTREAEEQFFKSATTPTKTRLTASSSLQIKLEALYSLTELMINDNRLDSAFVLIEAVIKDYPNIPAFYNLAGKIKLNKNDLINATNYFSTSLHLQPENNSFANGGLAEIYALIGDRNSSDKFTKRALAA